MFKMFSKVASVQKEKKTDKQILHTETLDILKKQKFYTLCLTIEKWRGFLNFPPILKRLPEKRQAGFLATARRSDFLTLKNWSRAHFYDFFMSWKRILWTIFRKCLISKFLRYAVVVLWSSKRWIKNLKWKCWNLQTLWQLLTLPTDKNETQSVGSCGGLEQTLNLTWHEGADFLSIHFVKNETTKKYAMHHIEVSLGSHEFPNISSSKKIDS